MAKEREKRQAAQREVSTNKTLFQQITPQMRAHKRTDSNGETTSHRESHFRANLATVPVQAVQLVENRTGIPDKLKSGLENLSGLDLSDVRVHRNSPKPAQLNALAYAQGQDIHLGVGQEKHLPHEGWHVVQQLQGRVMPTMQMRGKAVNDDPALEREADLMGAQAATQQSYNHPLASNMETAMKRTVDTHSQLYQQQAKLGASYPKQFVVQRTDQQNVDLLRSVPFKNPDPSYASEGSKGNNIKLTAEENFVTGEKGTWHHIYPRNKLKEHVANISRYLVATDGHEGEITETASHQAMQLVGTTISMNLQGRLAKPPHYYWKDGNGFLGIRSDRRTDDPGSNVEHEKPKTMNSSKYQLARDWGKELEKLSDTIGGLATIDSIEKMKSVSAKIKKEATNVATLGMQLDNYWPYRTNEAEGVDWKRTNTAVGWGEQQKNYETVK